MGDALIDTTTNLAERFARIRETTLQLTEPLSAEDCQVQTMLEVSPTKWHLAHTTWFFETFVLELVEKNFRPFHPRYRVLYNSYYEAVGEKHPRSQRGLLSRPSLEEVCAYRREIDGRMRERLRTEDLSTEVQAIVELGLQHEQQHQELLLMDIQHVLATNPLRCAYREVESPPEIARRPMNWLSHDDGLFEIGHQGPGFSFDNELPRHRVWLEAFSLADRLVTSGEYLEFMAAGGYERPELWLSDGWALARQEGWRAPLYWERLQGKWMRAGLCGLHPVREDFPVAHISFYEADAFARWSNARLPTEHEWEKAAALEQIVGSDPLAAGNFLEDGHFQALAATGNGARQLFGDLWEWTSSPYLPYPGYGPQPGALGEYNGKFMSNQMVLRGGSCVSPRSHLRASYRNFYTPASRWQFGGLRLCRDVDR